ncbi:hypothetical protein BV25DRAFT_70733 [Artomyces pyxidatus]|uniref:Uncharacterized protein n=1 Tax=Artomyces pyxidatus TaxID=48021 RepID=A0ACB8TKP5_9AGAM|nr:hypothetical protein BV25DRAFT_70733 [Artomyces pyxidatus]
MDVALAEAHFQDQAARLSTPPRSTPPGNPLVTDPHAPTSFSGDIHNPGAACTPKTPLTPMKFSSRASFIFSNNCVPSSATVSDFALARIAHGTLPRTPESFEIAPRLGLPFLAKTASEDALPLSAEQGLAASDTDPSHSQSETRRLFLDGCGEIPDLALVSSPSALATSNTGGPPAGLTVNTDLHTPRTSPPNALPVSEEILASASTLMHDISSSVSTGEASESLLFLPQDLVPSSSSSPPSPDSSMDTSSVIENGTGILRLTSDARQPDDLFLIKMKGVQTIPAVQAEDLALPSSSPSSPDLSARSPSSIVEGGSSPSLPAPSSSPLSHPATDFGNEDTLVDIMDDKVDCTQLSPARPSRTIMSSPGPSFLDDEPVACSSPAASRTVLGKRGQELSNESSIERDTQVKRFRMDDTMSSPPRSAPAPRRPTQASQRLSHKKLITPFRTPFRGTAMSNALKTEVDTDTHIPPPAPCPPRGGRETSNTPGPFVQRLEKPNIAKTMTKLALASKAASQFRSPFAATSTGDRSRTVILPTQTIQALERKVTTLRRAVKIKHEGDAGKLDSLARKWRDAGREAAYELWSIVRNRAEEVNTGGKSGGDWGWGPGPWDEKEGNASAEGGMDDGMDLDIGKEHADEDAEEERETLGIMLRKLGIAPETLGWNDAEEVFLDD